jgi:hypothetical protein
MKKVFVCVAVVLGLLASSAQVSAQSALAAAPEILRLEEQGSKCAEALIQEAAAEARGLPPEAFRKVQRETDRMCGAEMTSAMMAVVNMAMRIVEADSKNCRSNVTKASRLPGGLCVDSPPDPDVLQKFHAICEVWVPETGVEKPKQCDDLVPLPPKKK